jgi:spore coat protein CotH
MLRFSLSFALLVAACSDDRAASNSDAGPDAGAMPDGPAPDAGDPSAPLFDPEHLIGIQIDMDASDWDELRTQTRSLFELLGGDCLAQPFPSPFTYFTATVTVDGTRIENVAVRKKGFLGSLDDVRPSLKIKFDEYVPDQQYLGLTRLTLNNAKQDPSFARQCLAYRIFDEAGVPSSRCNFARVTVNGEELGLYVNVESMDKHFLARHYADNDGNLYEGTLSDFRAGWTGTFDKKTNESDPDRSDLDRVVTAAEANDADLAGSLGTAIDVDEFVTFWATEVMIGHWDGYSSNENNFFVYHDPTTDRFHFLPYGPDGAFPVGSPPNPGPTDPPIAATGYLARRLYLNPATQDDYLGRLRMLVDDLWSKGTLIESIDQMEGVISQVTPDAATPLDALRQYVLARGDSIKTQLDAGPPAWDQPLRQPPCLQTIGTIDGTFTTTWGTVGGNPFATGTGTLDLTVSGNTPTFSSYGSDSGLDPNPQQGTQPRALVEVVGLISGGPLDGDVAVAILAMDQGLFSPGTVTFDFASAYGVLYRFVPADGSFTPIALIGAGSAQLDQASMGSGDPVQGSFSADLIAWPF